VIKDKHAILIIIGIASALILWSNLDGLGLTRDSYYYMAQASKLRDIGFISYLSNYGIQQKALIFLISLSDQHSCEITALANSVFFVGAVSIWVVSSRNLFRDRFIWMCFGLFTAINTPMILGSSFLWTEAFFYLIIACCFFYFGQTRNNNFLIYCGFTVVALFARKAGLLIVLGSLIYWELSFETSNTRKAIIFSLAAFLLYLLYGNLGFPNLIGEQPSLDFIYQNTVFQLKTLGRWVSPFYPTIIGSFIILAILLTLRMRNNRTVVLSTIIVLTYLVVRLFFEREFEEEHERYLSVIYPLFWLVICLRADQCGFKGKQKLITISALGLILIYQSVRVIQNIMLWSSNGCLVE